MVNVFQQILFDISNINIMNLSNITHKALKYSNLSRDLEYSVFRIKLIPVENGARGLDGK